MIFALKKKKKVDRNPNHSHSGSVTSTWYTAGSYYDFPGVQIVTINGVAKEDYPNYGGGYTQDDPQYWAIADRSQGVSWGGWAGDTPITIDWEASVQFTQDRGNMIWQMIGRGGSYVEDGVHLANPPGGHFGFCSGSGSVSASGTAHISFVPGTGTVFQNYFHAFSFQGSEDGSQWWFPDPSVPPGIAVADGTYTLSASWTANYPPEP